MTHIDLDDIPEAGKLLSDCQGIQVHLLPDGTTDVTDCFERED